MQYDFVRAVCETGDNLQVFAVLMWPPRSMPSQGQVNVSSKSFLSQTASVWILIIKRVVSLRLKGILVLVTFS